MGAERRKHERLRSNLIAVIRSSIDTSKLGRGVVSDMSVGGMAIETETALEVGRDYEIDIEIPVTLYAKVVRSLTPGHMKKYGFELNHKGLLSKILFKKLLKGKRATQKL